MAGRGRLEISPVTARRAPPPELSSRTLRTRWATRRSVHAASLPLRYREYGGDELGDPVAVKRLAVHRGAQ
jgi:hypothetical protein